MPMAFLCPANSASPFRGMPLRGCRTFAPTCHVRETRRPGTALHVFNPSCHLRLSPVPSAAYAIYIPYISFLSPAHRPGLPIQNSLQEALLLSLNFDFVLPLSFPAAAPVLHPCFEGLFSFTVAFATLLIGFAVDTPGHADAVANAKPAEDTEQQIREDYRGGPSVPYSSAFAALLVPFLTNISWLPYLALRPSRPPESWGATNVPGFLRRLSQSPLLPVYSVAVALVSVPYCLFARAESFTPGAVARTTDLLRLVSDNILANSFAADCFVFALFQAWLVNDDMSARGWQGRRAERARFAARYVPFFGLAWYLFERATDPGVKQF